MIKLWVDGAIPVQKFGIILLLVVFFLPIQALLSHSFVPSQSANQLAIWAALFLTVIFLIFSYYVRKITPVKVDLPYSGFKLVLVTFILPFIVYGCIWINLAVSVPQLFTLAFGDNQLSLGYAVKSHTSSRRSCDYRLTPVGINFWLFHYCIPYGLYATLPDDEFEVQLVTKNSSFGIHYSEIKVMSGGR